MTEKEILDLIDEDIRDAQEEVDSYRENGDNAYYYSLGKVGALKYLRMEIRMNNHDKSNDGN